MKHFVIFREKCDKRVWHANFNKKSLWSKQERQSLWWKASKARLNESDKLRRGKALILTILEKKSKNYLLWSTDGGMYCGVKHL